MRQVDVGLGEPAEDDRGQQLELGRRPRPTRDPVGGGDDLADEPGERRRIDGPSVDLEPLPIADEVRLGRLADPVAGRPERRAGEGEHAALAVRPGHQRAAERRAADRRARGAAPASGPAPAGSRSGRARCERPSAAAYVSGRRVTSPARHSRVSSSS